MALAVIKPACDAFGGRWVLVECHNEKSLTDFYRNNHFEHIMNVPDKDVPMIQLVRKFLENIYNEYIFACGELCGQMFLIWRQEQLHLH